MFIYQKQGLLFNIKGRLCLDHFRRFEVGKFYRSLQGLNDEIAQELRSGGQQGMMVRANSCYEK
jgi:hypothetical protein